MSQPSNLPQGAEELTKHLLNISPSNNDSQNKITTAPSPQYLPNEETSKQIINSPIVTPIPTLNINKQSPSLSVEKEEPLSSLDLNNRQKQSRSISPTEINQLWSQLSKKLDNHQDTNIISPLQKQQQYNDNNDNNNNNNNSNNNNNKNKQYYYYNEEEEEIGRKEFDHHYDKGIWTIGFFLFWFGFLCPLLWIVGSFWPKKPDHHGKMAHRWQMINRAMAIGFCILLVCILIAMGVWYSQTPH